MSDLNNPNSHKDPMEEFRSTYTRLAQFFIAPGSSGYGAIPLLALAVGVPYVSFLGLRELASILVQNDLKPLLYVMIGLTVFIVAAIAYRIRCTARLFYGLMEVVFGIVVSLLAAEELLTNPNLREVITLQVSVPIIAGIYICIRGLNNIEDGILERKPITRTTTLSKLWWYTFHKSLALKAEKLSPPDGMLMVYYVMIAICSAFMLLLLGIPN